MLAEHLLRGFGLAIVAALGGVYVYERLALWRGRDGLNVFVERDGCLLEKSYLRSLDVGRRSGPMRFVRQLRADLTSPVALIFIVLIASTLFVGISNGKGAYIKSGALLAALYVWMFVATFRQGAAFDRAPRFEANLVSVKGPVFLSHGTATARTDDGHTFSTGVRWRSVEALRRRGPVRLVFIGSPARPMFIGVRPGAGTR